MTAVRRKLATLITLQAAIPCSTFTIKQRFPFYKLTRLYSDSWDAGGGTDSNSWSSADEPAYPDQDDWQDLLAKKKDGSYWSQFEPSSDVEKKTAAPVDTAEAWLDTLASLAAEEVEFNLKEADRADKARQMEEWGFEKETIKNTLDVAVDDSLESSEEVIGMSLYREQSYWDDDVDLTTVESHTRVEIDEETGEPVRTQMVYVDEHTWYVSFVIYCMYRRLILIYRVILTSIGCTNCAMIAQSTFFMHQEHGRARVFDQWGDDDETIQIAIETCPVDCIHYVPYDELVKLEVERRNQNINFKARLVSQGEYGGLSQANLGGGPNAFTAPQRISGNMGTRCNNCPSRGCQTCPMYGVGKNPVFEKKEKERKERLAKKRLLEQRERENKSVDL